MTSRQQSREFLRRGLATRVGYRNAVTSVVQIAGKTTSNDNNKRRLYLTALMNK